MIAGTAGRELLEERGAALAAALTVEEDVGVRGVAAHPEAAARVGGRLEAELEGAHLAAA